MSLLFVVASVLAAPAAETDFRSYLDQAEFFLRKDWYDDAEEQLVFATEHPDGQHDPLAWYLLSTTRIALGDVTGARIAAGRAQTNARTIEQAEQASDLVQYLQTTYGELVLTGPEGTSARVDLVLTSMLFDAQAQETALVVRDVGRAKGLLPRTIGLPAGSWLVNDVPVDIVAGESLTMRVPDGGGPSGVVTAFDQSEIELGLGIAGWQGKTTEALFPAPQLTVAMSWPLGPIEFAVTATWQPQTYLRRDDQLEGSALGGGAGVRLGVPLSNAEPWIFRPALTYRMAWIPGMELSCLRQTDAFSCSQGGPADLLLYGVGRAHVPGIELALARIERRRTFSVGFGLRASAERAFGVVPGGGLAQPLSDGTDVRYTTDPDDRRFTATGWSVSTLVLLAL